MSDADRLGDRLKHEGQDFKGKAKEAAGKVTGNEHLEAEGESEQLSAKVKKAGDDVRDVADDVKDKLT